MPFRSYDALRLFIVVARHLSFTAAGKALSLTKGAVSYQIKQLEKELGFELFLRRHNGISLTEKGSALLASAQSAFSAVEQEIGQLRGSESSSIVVGASTYFASRWLSTRLMAFIEAYPNIRLRLQPVIGPGDLEEEQLDLMIRWGTGDWDDAQCKLLFHAPAIATAGQAVAKLIESIGLEAALPTLTLLHDREGSTAWRDWFAAAELDYRPKPNPLIIPDPNVRVEALVNGQGIALNDWLISAEIESKRLSQISLVELPQYGYFLVYQQQALKNPALLAFHDWILSESNQLVSAN